MAFEFVIDVASHSRMRPVPPVEPKTTTSIWYSPGSLWITAGDSNRRLVASARRMSLTDFVSRTIYDSKRHAALFGRTLESGRDVVIRYELSDPFTWTPAHFAKIARPFADDTNLPADA